MAQSALPGSDGPLLQRIEDAGPERNLDVLQEVLDSLRSNASDPERYANMVNSAFVTLYNQGTNNRAQAARLEQEWALSALNDPDSISTLTELRLVMRLRAAAPREETPRSEADRVKFDVLLHAWRRMEQDTNKDFDFSDRPLLNVAPPRGDGGLIFSGMDPNAIKDSRLRNEYIAAINKNRAKSVEFNRQFELRKISGPFVQHAEDFLLSALRAGTITDAEALGGLTQVRDDNARERIVAHIRSMTGKF